MHTTKERLCLGAGRALLRLPVVRWVVEFPAIPKHIIPQASTLSGVSAFHAAAPSLVYTTVEGEGEGLRKGLE